MHSFMLLVTSDRNKPHLSHLVPLCTRALEMTPPNHKLMTTSICTLSQLLFEPRSLPSFEACKSRLIPCLDSITQSGVIDRDTLKNASILRHSLDEMGDNSLSLPIFIKFQSPNVETAKDLAKLLKNSGYQVELCMNSNQDPFIIETAFAVIVLISEPPFPQKM